MINKIDFKAKNLTSNAGLFLLLENAKSNGIFDFIENDLVFDNDSTNKIKMNHIKTMLCGHFIGIDKLERLKLLQNDPLVNEFDISVKEPETVSRFLGNFNFKTTQMFRDINFKVFKKLLTKSKLTSITIDIDTVIPHGAVLPPGLAAETDLQPSPHSQHHHKDQRQPTPQRPLFEGDNGK
ncbi:hypothetical protein STW0522ENT51_P40650 (plasmid) [Enterobacter kobei]|uniref:Truncated transposase n=1 Tax=Klebsiella pneumoniae TaxID=573 RepID=A7KGB6_KLEPN|nr:truncated transposase [Klebsiella pneumoniae]BBV73871.1 hypothetical protein STW0522ENT51_P40650 [Enterobacter kobei]